MKYWEGFFTEFQEDSWKEFDEKPKPTLEEWKKLKKILKLETNLDKKAFYNMLNK